MRKLTAGLLVLALACGAGTPWATAAEDVASAIAQNMKESGKLKNYRVGVKYEDGVAWLLGSVTSPQQKKIAEQLARGTQGVEAVISRIEIKQAEGASPEPSLTADSIPTPSLEPAAEPMPQQIAPVAATRAAAPRGNAPLPYAYAGQQHVQPAGYAGAGAGGPGMAFGGAAGPVPSSQIPPAVGQSVSYDNPQLPGYAWPSYAASPNYAALTYPKQYSPSAWPYIGPFYPYPQVPLGWRKVTLEWDDGWWFLDFKDCKHCQ